MPPSKPALTKDQVNYQPGTSARHCGNCVMSHFPGYAPGVAKGRCDLVIGPIGYYMACDRWEAK